MWLTTNHRLDWPPPTYNAEKQKQNLTEIFDDLKSKKINTVYFQVRSGGTVMFNSSFEAYSQYLTGKVNGTPQFDPLKLAIELAHKRGIEIHAWLNIVKVFEGKDSSEIQNPLHLCRKKPEWIVEDFRDGQKAYWVDPGLPEVRNYITDLITELAENYNVDGIHLDYIRYPGKNFDDDFSFRLYGKNQNRDDWRRSNITSIVEAIFKGVKSVSRYIKIGAAPIGIFKNIRGAKGWESYYEIYQDSYGWLKKGIVDYLTPQTYWGISENPKFDLLADEWMKNSNGKNIVFGIAAYKDNVKEEIDELISYSRKINSAGVCFFRYEHIKNLPLRLFDYKAFPAEMPWLDGIYPSPPVNLAARFNSDLPNVFTLSWQSGKNESPEDSISYYSIYNLPAKTSLPNSEYLFEVLPAEKNNVKLAIDEPQKVNYYFTIKSVNKVWTESKEPSNTVTVQMPVMKNLLFQNEQSIQPFLIKEGNRAVICIQGEGKENIEIYGFTAQGSKLLLDHTLLSGKNIIALEENISSLSRLRIIWSDIGKEVELNL